MKKLNVDLSNTVPKTRTEPLWDLYRDGITFSLLTRFIICRHRFWIRTVLGLRDDVGFNHTTEYGSLFHAGLEAFAGSVKKTLNSRIDDACDGIFYYVEKLIKQFPDDREVILDWGNLAKRQFNIYAHYHSKNDKGRTYIAQEQIFSVPVTLPSGRTLNIRGKFDEVFEELTPKKKLVKVLQENKCKGEVDQEAITSSLAEDLQTMLYVVVLNHENCPIESVTSCKDVLYNVILRPLGGKYPMRQLKGRMVKGVRVGAEDKAMFHDRAIKDIETDPTKYFHRWRVSLSEKDISNFREQTLYPILEQLCDWWDSIKSHPFDPWNTQGFERVEGSTFRPIRVANKNHSKRPLGVYDSMARGYGGDFFTYITSHGMNKTGLKQLDSVFPELDDPSLSNYSEKLARK